MTSTPTLSIEFAHAQLSTNGGLSHAAALRSTDVAVAIASVAAAEKAPATTCILIDDKQVPRSERERIAALLLDAVESRLRVDFVCYETELANYVDDLLGLIGPDRARKRVARNLSSWMRKYGSLPCSADIAIWHLMRLGLIEDRHQVLLPCDSNSTFQPSDIAVSILQDDLADYETAAREKILRSVRSLQADRSVIPIYYPVVVSQNSDMRRNELISEAVEEVRDAIRAHN